MAKRDTVKERLEYWLEEFVDWREILPADEYRARYRRKIADCPDWKPVDRAAQYFGLDPADPTDLKVLLRLLAHVVFSEPKKQGRKKGSDKWDVERYLALGARLHELETKVGSRLSDSQAARKLVEDYTEYGREWTTLRQRLPKARREFELANIDIEMLMRPSAPEVDLIEGLTHSVKCIKALAHLAYRDAEAFRSLGKTREGRKEMRRRHKEIGARKAMLQKDESALLELLAAIRKAGKAMDRKAAKKKKSKAAQPPPLVPTLQN